MVPIADDVNWFATSNDGKRKVAYDYYFHLFLGEPDDVLPAWVFQSWGQRTADELRDLNGFIVRVVLAKMLDGKPCHTDCVVAEMLKYLDDQAYDEIALHSKCRVLNHVPAEDEHIWSEHFVTMIRERMGVVSIKDFWPIAVLPVMFKVFSSCLQLLAGPAIFKLRVPQFAFRL